MLTLYDIMTRDVIYVSPDTPITEIVAILRTEGITGVPVMAQGRVVGVISNSDIIEFEQDFQLMEESLHIDDAYSASDIMTRKLCALPSDTSLEAAARQMVDANVHRLLVIDAGKLVGIATSMDFLRTVAEGKLTSNK